MLSVNTGDTPDLLLSRHNIRVLAAYTEHLLVSQNSLILSYMAAKGTPVTGGEDESGPVDPELPAEDRMRAWESRNR